MIVPPSASLSSQVESCFRLFQVFQQFILRTENVKSFFKIIFYFLLFIFLLFLFVSLEAQPPPQYKCKDTDQTLQLNKIRIHNVLLKSLKSLTWSILPHLSSVACSDDFIKECLLDSAPKHELRHCSVRLPYKHSRKQIQNHPFAVFLCERQFLRFFFLCQIQSIQTIQGCKM